MAMTEDFMEQMISSMKPEDKERMMEKMMGKFFEDMKPEEKQKMMENMMSKMMGNMNMSEMMPMMMSKMMGGMMGRKKEGEPSSSPATETQKEFKPWEFCPCRNQCQKAFETGSKKGEK